MLRAVCSTPPKLVAHFGRLPVPVVVSCLSLSAKLSKLAQHTMTAAPAKENARPLEVRCGYSDMDGLMANVCL